MSSENDEKKSEKRISQGILLGINLTSQPPMGVVVSREDQLAKLEELENGIELIPNELRLRFVKKEDLERIISNKLMMKIYKPEFGRALIEWEHDDPEAINETFNPITKTLLALRLLKSNPVFLSFFYNFSKDSKSIENASFYETLPKHRLLPPYSFNIYDKKALKDILDKLLSMDFKENTSIRIACDRFSKSYHDINPEDKLIDLMISFEALFIRSRKGNKGHRIGKKCSELIKIDKAEQKTIYCQLKESYSIRNDVLHGSPFNRADIFQRLPYLEDYLRRSILRLIP